MALLTSGAISLGGTTTGRSVNIELGRSGTATISMNEAAVRSLAGRASGAISMNNFYGKTAFTPLVYTFASTRQSWVGQNATLSASSGALIVNSTATDPIVRSPVGTTWPGSGGVVIRITIRRTSGTGWDGNIFYTTGTHGESELFKNIMPEPEWDGTFKLIEMNMSNLVAGGSDYITNTITRLRLDFGLTAVDDFQIDQIEITTGPVLLSGWYGTRYVGDFTGATYSATQPYGPLDNVNFSGTFTPQGELLQSTSIQSLERAEDFYSFEWLGYFYAQQTGDYTFTTTSDDSSYVWIGDNALSGYTILNANVDNGGPHGAITITSAPVSLIQNTYYPIRVIHGQGTGGRIMSLSFTPPDNISRTAGTGWWFYNSATNGF
jgi:hypothetical protein